MVRSGIGVGTVWVVDDFPQVSVGVAEVAGVDAPGAVVQFGDGRPRRLGFRQKRVYLVAGRDDVAETELAAPRWPPRDARVFREFAARVTARPKRRTKRIARTQRQKRQQNTSSLVALHRRHGTLQLPRKMRRECSAERWKKRA
jgi:hypothetical protein